MSHWDRTRIAVVTATGIWATTIGAGLLAIHRYESTPGGAWTAGDEVRPSAAVRPDPGRANLVMLAHPRCPCTRASLEELAQVMNRCRGQVAAHVLFFQPQSGPDGWARSDLWRRAAAIPGVLVYDDPGGAEAARLGAETSGSVILYDRSGRQRFKGGITGARGQVGDNPGRDAVVACVSGGQPASANSPIFGCAIRAIPQIASGP